MRPLLVKIGGLLGSLGGILTIGATFWSASIFRYGVTDFTAAVDLIWAGHLIFLGIGIASFGAALGFWGLVLPKVVARKSPEGEFGEE